MQIMSIIRALLSTAIVGRLRDSGGMKSHYTMSHKQHAQGKDRLIETTQQ